MHARVASMLSLAVLLGASGCAEEGPFPAACDNVTSADIERALAAAPGRVRLADDTPLSRCVGRAVESADVQGVGASFTAAADHFAARIGDDDRAALQLGYLVGAAQRGARDSSGTQLELIRRLETTVGLDSAPAHRRRAFERGRAAGIKDG